MSKLDDAIAAVMAASQKPGCWASHLEGDAAKFVARLKEEEDKGNKPNRAATSKILNDVWGVKISDERIRNHFRGSCSCG